MFMNNGIEALLRLLSDMVVDLTDRSDVTPLASTPMEIFDACCYYLDPLVDHLAGLSPDEAGGYQSCTAPGQGCTTTGGFSVPSARLDPSSTQRGWTSGLRPRTGDSSLTYISE